MNLELRSGCAINLTLEALGDRWSLIVIRDIMFGNRRHFRDLLTNSVEGIASNILAARLKRLVDLGLLTRADDPTHAQKGVYSLSDEMSIRARMLEEGGPKLWGEFMDELRALHLGRGAKRASNRPSVFERLTAAYEEAVKRGKKR
jgi:DNA-binding HxlR family transcriptional regulator